MHRLLSIIAAVGVVAASLAITSGNAWAHERRTVGPYQLVVGFINEPAFAGAPNSLDLRISDTRTNPATPVEGLEKTLTATVTAGGLTPLPIEIKTRFNQPGAYAGYFVPTTPGQYVFTIKGKIGTTDVNEKFESGPGRFNDVEAVTAIQYPVKVPEGSDLVARLDAIQSTADRTQWIAIAALALGVIAIGAAVLGRRRS